MPRIESFVFFDLETTGLPFQEKNQTKIIEFSIVAATRVSIEHTSLGQTPPVTKLTFVVNPTRPIHPKVTTMTGLTNKFLTHAPLFKEKIETIKSFLVELPKPVCLVAHNGNVFDFKILLAELNDANACLPSDLLCVDSLVGFRKLLKASNIDYEYLKGVQVTSTTEDILTDDEDDLWPTLELSKDDLDQLDELCSSLSDISCDSFLDDDIIEGQSVPQTKLNKKVIQENRSKGIEKIFKNNNLIKLEQKEKECYTLSALYKRLLNKEEDNAHRAEVDCLMLAQCIVALKEDFLPWADEACKLLTEIKPLVRYG